MPTLLGVFEEFHRKPVKAKINNMLVSGNMTPPKMGRKVGKNFYFKKKFCPIFYFMTHLFPTAQLKNRGVEAQGHKKKYFNCFTVYAIYFASLIFRESGLQDIFASG